MTTMHPAHAIHNAHHNHNSVLGHEPRLQRAPAYLVTPVVAGAATLESAAIPPGQVWAIRAVIVATDGGASGVGNATICTDIPSDWTQAIFFLTLAGGLATWEPRRLVMSDGQKLYAGLTGANTAANARLELLYQPLDVLPERTQLDATHIRVDHGPHLRLPAVPDVTDPQTPAG